MRNFSLTKLSAMVILFLFIWSQQSLAQSQVSSSDPIGKIEDEHVGCAIDVHVHELMQKDPAFKKAREEALQSLKNGDHTMRSVTDNVVPVVFHIIPPCEGEFDFTKEQLQEYLDEVNVDFAGTNNTEYNCAIDPAFCGIQAGDIGLEFKLATVDPNGNPTEGITRTHSFYSYDGMNNAQIKELIQWDHTKYLNIWVVQQVAYGNFSAFATYPSSAVYYPTYDGIVTDFRYLGENNPYVDNGRPNTLTHEIGHWFELHHTWGYQYGPGWDVNCDTDDLVDDTPNCKGTTYCPNIPVNSCNDGAGDLDDNLHNFMDYSCQTMFTEGQKDRMWSYINADVGGRGQCVTTMMDALVFQDNHADVGEARIQTDKFVFTEEFFDQGNVTQTAEIVLEDCAGCSFVNNLSGKFTVNGPAVVTNGITITKTSATTANLEVNLNFMNPVQHDALSDLFFDIQFQASAINGINNVNEVFNDALLAGFKVDFNNPGTGVLHTDITDGQNPLPEGAQYWVYIGIPYVFQGIYIDNFFGYYRMQPAYPADMPIEVAIDPGTSFIKKLESGEEVSSQSFIPIGPLGNSVLFSSDWADSEGYVGLKIPGLCGEVFYAYIRLDFRNNEMEIIYAVINQDEGNGLPTDLLPECVPYAASTEFNYISNVEINDLVNQSGDNGGYEFFNSPTTELLEGETYNVLCEALNTQTNIPAGEWHVYIDLNGNGSYVDPEDYIFSKFNAMSIDEAIELIPANTLNGQSEINTTMMIIYSWYDLSIHPFCADYPFQYGEVEEYNVTITSSGACTPPEPCIPMGCDQAYLFIDQVQLNDIDNTSGNDGGYAFFSSETTDIVEGTDVNVQCTNGGIYENDSYSKWHIYVDLNADGDYLDPSELRYIGYNINDVNANVPLIPTGYLNGQAELATTMMVVLSVHDIVDICQVIAYGEVEEYPITIVGNCPTPHKSDITRSLWCNNKMFLKTTAYIGVLHQYRYRKQGTTTWTEMNPTTAASISMGILPECTLYDIQLRVFCDGTNDWTDWSGSRFYRTRALRATPSSMTAQAGDWWAYLILNNYPGDSKIFRYREVGEAWITKPATTSHYVFLDNLSPNTNYQFQVRRRCGTIGYYSCQSVVHNFSTTASGAMNIGNPPTQDLEVAQRKRMMHDVNVYPNPFAGDRLTVEMPDENITHLRLLNLNGKVVLDQDFEGSNSVDVFIENLDAGMYLLHINEKIVKRIVRTK